MAVPKPASRRLGLLGALVLSAVSLLIIAGPAPSSAIGCGQCRGGTLDMDSLSCPGAHTNCLECGGPCAA